MKHWTITMRDGNPVEVDADDVLTDGDLLVFKAGHGRSECTVAAFAIGAWQSAIETPAGAPQRAQPERAKPPAKPGNGAPKARRGSISARIVDSIHSTPHSVREIAKAVYGSDSPMYRARVSAFLHALSRRDVVRRSGKGQWVAP